MKKTSTSKKALCFLLTTFLMIASVSFPSLSLNTVDISEESTEFSEQNVDTTDFIDLNSVLAENSIGSVGINNGDYYIINVISKKFIENPGDFTISVSSLSHQADISWTFEDLGYEEYCIRDPLNNNLALFAIGNEVELGNAGSSPSSYYRWNILLAENGECIIKNKGSDSVLRFDGSSISLDWEPDSDDEDYAEYTWMIVEDDKYIHFSDHYYDDGFAFRFSAIDTDTERLIKSYCHAVAERFLSIFDLRFISSSYTSYTSTADLCKIQTDGALTINSCDGPCLHPNQIHTNSTIFRNDLPNGTSTSTVSIWTGHLLANGGRSNSVSSRHSILISSWLTNTLIQPLDEAQIAVENIFDLAHELSHQIGAHDHYCYGKGENGLCRNSEFCDICKYKVATPRACLMSYRYNIDNLSDEEMFCDECIQYISAHLSDHH